MLLKLIDLIKMQCTMQNFMLSNPDPLFPQDCKTLVDSIGERLAGTQFYDHIGKFNAVIII